MTNEISLDKVYTTADGREVRIYAVDGGGEWPVHGSVKRKDGTWRLSRWDENGASKYAKENNLVEKPKIISIRLYLNVYNDELIYVHRNLSDAIRAVGCGDLKARKLIEFTVREGEFDE